jgi:hypothetical protein
MDLRDSKAHAPNHRGGWQNICSPNPRPEAWREPVSLGSLSSWWEISSKNAKTHLALRIEQVLYLPSLHLPSLFFQEGARLGALSSCLTSLWQVWKQKPSEATVSSHHLWKLKLVEWIGLLYLVRRGRPLRTESQGRLFLPNRDVEGDLQLPPIVRTWILLHNNTWGSFINIPLRLGIPLW